ncbi:MAG: hypothetical protein AABX14_00865 [Candidatus Aenigmatarchaeota archaeon]
MISIVTRIKSFQEVWADDKELAKLSHPSLAIDWNADLPDQQNAYSILAAKCQQWQNPAKPFQLSHASLSDVLDFLIVEVQNVWGDRLREKPGVEILPKERYLPRINELERETNEKFGCGNLCQSPPTMYHSPSHGILLMPENYLVRAPRGHSGNDITSPDFDVTELAWDRPFFEEVLCEELCHVLFRQSRGEWKSDYVKSMKAVGAESECRIRSINKATAQYAKELIARNVRHEWGLYVAAEKISVAWQDKLGMNDYLGIEALSVGRKLAQAAMVDDIDARYRVRVMVSFDPRHPSNDIKEQRFYGG